MHGAWLLQLFPDCHYFGYVLHRCFRSGGNTYNYRVRAEDTNNFYGPYSAVATASIPAYFDNAADGGNNGGSTTSLTYSYTVGTNSNRLLLVNLMGDVSVDDISSVTYAGVPMTLVNKVQTPSDRWHYLYYLLSPSSGTNNCSHNGREFPLPDLRGGVMVQHSPIGPTSSVHDSDRTGESSRVHDDVFAGKFEQRDSCGKYVGIFRNHPF